MKLMWHGGSSRFDASKVADVMRIVKKDDGRELLYIEEVWNGPEESTFRVFWNCLEKLVVTAKEKGINVDHIIPWDHYGSPVEHFETLDDTPEALRPFLAKYYEGDECYI